MHVDLRLSVVTAASALLLAAGSTFAAEMLFTPSGQHVQNRVDQLLRAHSVPLLTPGSVPPLLIKAVIATEDERFYQDGGIDPLAVARATLFDAINQCWCQGGSTITQQLVKLVYLNGSDRGSSKLTDAAIAIKVNSVLSKQQVLIDYLSVVPSGPDLVGVDQAACVYFGLPLRRLTLSEAALLAGLPQAPDLYDPILHPAEASARRNEVLQAMVSAGDITPLEASQSGRTALNVSQHLRGCAQLARNAEVAA